MSIGPAMLAVVLATLDGAVVAGAASGTDSVPCTERADAMVGIALDSFRQDVGRYPTTAEGLGALRVRPAAVPEWADGRRFGWDGPYLDRERDLRDPRGRAFGYRSPAADGRSYELWVIEGTE